MYKISCFILPTALLLFMPRLAAADTGFALTSNQSNFTLQSGQTATVSVQLVQTGDFLLASEGGLLSLNFWVRRDDAASVTPGPATITAYSLTTAFTGQPSINVASTSDLDVTLFQDFGSTSGPSGLVLDLATLQIKAGSTPGLTRFHLLDNPDFDETLTLAGALLDPYIASNDFTVTVVAPEPGGTVLLAIPLAALLGRTRKRV
jgi:hypothetical protein